MFRLTVTMQAAATGIKSCSASIWIIRGNPQACRSTCWTPGCRPHSYTDYDNNGRSVSPDYENPLLRQALTNFIAALGARYDGDPRIGFVTVGLLGFWGEWHTYPHTDWFASTVAQNEVLTTMNHTDTNG